MAGRRRPQNKKVSASSGQLRIIGGRWRGTKLTITDTVGLRPTPDRVRETLFNWLAADIHDAKCLDLFAGTGALGLEALSRGAKLCHFIEQSAAASQLLATQFERLEASSAQLENTDAMTWLSKDQVEVFDIVFIDPPYHRGLAAKSCEMLINNNRLSSEAIIYLEMASDEQPPEILQKWQLHREKNAGQVCYRLYRREK